MEKYVEQTCINAAEKILHQDFSRDEYCLNGASESAICLENSNGHWDVFLYERNARENEIKHSNIVEALFDMFERLAGKAGADGLKEHFLAAIIGKQTA